MKNVAGGILTRSVSAVPDSTLVNFGNAGKPPVGDLKKQAAQRDTVVDVVLSVERDCGAWEKQRSALAAKKQTWLKTAR
jgi:hypothetical protein